MSDAAFQRLSVTENALVGVAAGALEVTCLQPVLYCKNASQQKYFILSYHPDTTRLKLVLDPRIMYRGLAMSITNMAVLTGLQFPLTGAITRLITGGKERRLTDAEMVSAAFWGGVISGVACAPMELVMIQQQRFGGNILATPARLASSHGIKIFSRGLITSSGREGLFTAGYLGLAPSVTRFLSEKYQFADSAARICGAIGAGLVSATLSHPLDTIKTCMQGDVEQATYKSMSQTATSLYQEGGFVRMYRGWGWRTARMILGIFILNIGKSFFAPLLCPHHFRE